MTLVPMFKLGSLAEPTAIVWGLDEHPVVPVVLDIKQRRNLQPVEALQPWEFVFTELVVLDAEWKDGHPALTYGIEDFEIGNDIRESRHPDHLTLYRCADESRMDGPWWSPSAHVARQEGGGRHENPYLYSAVVPASAVLLETVTRFGKLKSPSEFVVDTRGLDINRIS